MVPSRRFVRSSRLRSLPAALPALALALVLGACGGDGGPLDPEVPDSGVEVPPPPPPSPTDGGAGASDNSYAKAGVTASGTVTETPDGLIVDGSLSLTAGDRVVEFTGARMRVQYNAQGKVAGMSGTARIPSPHERIEFADPVEADIGLFSGAWLNENRDLPLRLQDDTDYFVYRVKTAFEMRIATGETGPDATRPVALRAPIGGEILMVVDYTDPMYFVFGAHDVLGSAGFGWSLNGRIPFVPDLPVEGLGTFDGRNTRVGSFPVYKVISVDGQIVDNETTEVHLTAADPFASELSRSYQAGFNGQASLDLFFEDFVGIDLPLAYASGGVYGSASVQNGLGAHAYVRGETADFSWWPTFLPLTPASSLEAQAFVQATGAFGVELDGQYGWTLPFGTFAMTGRFSMAPDSVGVTGGLVAASTTFEVSGGFTSRATSLDIEPPAELVERVTGDVQGRIDTEIAQAEQAWQDLQDATGAYEVELSLRGLRSQLPGIVDRAKSAANSTISSRLSSHTGTVYYSSLRSAVYAQRDAYFRELDALKAAALEIRDNDATRAAIERALRRVAARKTMTVTYRHKVLGVTVTTVTVTVRILSDAQAAQLLEAADNVKYIEETSERKLTLQQIYDTVPAKDLFERVRDGVLAVPTLQSLGLEYLHDDGAFSAYATLGSTRHGLGQVNVFDVPAMAQALVERIWEEIT